MCVLVSASGTVSVKECLLPLTKHVQCVLARAAAKKKLRLMEQACSCSTVRGGGGVKVRARVRL